MPSPSSSMSTSTASTTGGGAGADFAPATAEAEESQHQTLTVAYDTPVQLAHVEFQSLLVEQLPRKRKQISPSSAFKSSAGSAPAAAVDLKHLTEEELLLGLSAARPAAATNSSTTTATPTPNKPAKIDFDGVDDVAADDEEAVPEVEVTIHPSTSLRTKPWVIDRYLAPLYQAKTMGEMHQAFESVNESLRDSDIFDPRYTQLHLQPIQHPLQRLSTNYGHLKGNAVEEINEKRVQPTFLQKIYLSLFGSTAPKRKTSSTTSPQTTDEDDDDDDDDDDDAPFQLGGIPSPGSSATSISSSNDPRLEFKLLSQLKEKGRFGCRVGADVTNKGRVELKGKGKLTNYFGYGEIVEAEYSRGDVNTNERSFRTSFSISNLLWPGTRNSCHLFGHETALEQSSVNEKIKGFKMDWAFGPRHTIAYELAQRQLRAVSQPMMTTFDTASERFKSVFRPHSHALLHPPRFFEPHPHILDLTDPNHPGNNARSLKSALSYSYHRSTLNNPSIPSSGSRFFTKVELAGVGGLGDARFGKVQATLSKYFPITKSLSLGLTARGEYLHELSPKTFLSDKLFMPNPLSVRGVDPRTIGPCVGRDNLGGELLYTAGARLTYHVVPQLAIHAFANTGNVLSLNRGPAGSYALPGKVTTGMGVVVSPGGGARVEFNITDQKLELGIAMGMGDC